MPRSQGGDRVSFVHYEKDFPVGVYRSLDEFCMKTGKSRRSAEWMCQPIARIRGHSYIIRVITDGGVK